MASLGRYTHAIASRIPENYSTSDDKVKLEYQALRDQQIALISSIRSLGVDVLELPPDEKNPDMIFTQDLAVVVNGIALMCRPGPTPEKRQSEVDSVKAVLRKELQQTIVEMTAPKALLSGSGVLFTGREFFVGISDATNTEGALAVANTWPEYPCTPIKVPNFNCLKTYLSLAGPDVLSVGEGAECQAVLKRVEREATHVYKTLTVPEDHAANCLFVNGTLVHKGKEEAPHANVVFSEKVDYPRKTVFTSEFSKYKNPSRSISSLFIMLRKAKYVKRL